MASKPGEQLHHLCKVLFECGMPADHISDDDTMYALGPAQSAFRIEREVPSSGTIYVVYWLRPGNRVWDTCEYSISRHGDPEIQTPPPALLKGIALATPMPADWAWGVIESDQIKEMVLFGWHDDEDGDQRPSAQLMVIQDRARHNLKSQLYKSDWINLIKFWELVRSRRLICLNLHLRRAQAAKLGEKDSRYCVSLDGVLLAPPEMWARYPSLGLADLQSVIDMPRP